MRSLLVACGLLSVALVGLQLATAEPLQDQQLSWWPFSHHNHSAQYPGRFNHSVHYPGRFNHSVYPYRNYLLWGHALAAQPHNLILGYTSSGDWLMKTEPVKKSSSLIPFTKVKTSFTYSVPANDYKVITCVQAMDLATDGKGAYATLMSGGPGNRNVTLSFKSVRGGKINFMVYVYGH